MARYARKDAVRCAKNFAEFMHKQLGNCWEKRNGGTRAKVGCWVLDYAPGYGGAIIAEIMNEGGGETHPFGEGRLKPYEFCRALRYAEDAVKIDRKKR